MLICWNTFFTIKLHIYSIYKKKIKILSYDNLPPLTLVPRIKKDSRREWAVSAQGISLQKDVYMIHLLILLKHVTIEDCTDDIKWYEYMYSAQFQRKSSLEEVNMEISIISRKHILCPFAVYFVRYTVRLFFTISRIFLVSGTIKWRQRYIM